MTHMTSNHYQSIKRLWLKTRTLYFTAFPNCNPVIFVKYPTKDLSDAELVYIEHALRWREREAIIETRRIMKKQA